MYVHTYNANGMTIYSLLHSTNFCGHSRLIGVVHDTGVECAAPLRLPGITGSDVYFISNYSVIKKNLGYFLFLNFKRMAHTWRHGMHGVQITKGSLLYPPEDEDEENEQCEEGGDVVHGFEHDDELVAQRRKKAHELQNAQQTEGAQHRQPALAALDQLDDAAIEATTGSGSARSNAHQNTFRFCPYCRPWRC